MVNWHLITSSKGGVGKTVIASLLLACSRKKHGSVLVVDLNGMNADIRRLVGGGSSEKDRQYTWKMETTLSGQNLREFHVEKVGINNVYHMVCWPLNAFRLFTPEEFADFLYEFATTGKKQIEEKWGLTIGTIIIDTNYHFCNLFPHNSFEFFEHKVFNYFGNAKGEKGEENFFIWFIWVFRQLKNLFKVQMKNREQQTPYLIDALAVERGAQKIEGYLKNQRLPLPGTTGRTTPFIHVFSPNSLQEVARKEYFSASFLLEQLRGKPPCRIIPSLQNLANLGPNGQAVGFGDLLDALKDIYKRGPQQEEGAPQFLSRILDEYVSSLKKDHSGCPCNLVPLYYYEENLAMYNEYEHDKEIIFEMANLSIYDNFEQCYDRLFL